MPEEADQQQPDRDLAIIKSHALQLAEHFETVQIIVTRHMPEEDGTLVCHRGEGNFYARYGSVKRWLIGEESMMGHQIVTEDDAE